MPFNFSEAGDEDIPKIRELYQNSRKIPGCTWNDNYPTDREIMDDRKRHSLFVLKDQENELIGCISIDNDPEVLKLSCWSEHLAPRAELARLAVAGSYQNRGIAPLLIQNAMKEAKNRGYQSTCYLVSKHHERALRSYRKMHYNKAGETDLFGQEWWCYEKEL